MTKPIEGRTVLVVGASRGIGAATARAFAEGGAAVSLAARNLASCEEAAETIVADGGSALALFCDVATHASVEAMVHRTLDAFGRIDVLIHNAGVHEPIAHLLVSAPAYLAPWLSDNKE